MATEICSRCKAEIPATARRFQWKGGVVCVVCRAVLEREKAKAQAATPPSPPPPPPPPPSAPSAPALHPTPPTPPIAAVPPPASKELEDEDFQILAENAPPKYTLAIIMGYLLILCGFCEVILGLLIAVLAVTGFFNFPSGTGSVDWHLVLLGGGIGVGGLITAGFGQVVHCVRDLAINSFQA